MKLTSSAFKHNEAIPAKFTCDGKDVSPPLAWKDVPRNVKSFTLICDDPDAPSGTWVHWIVLNLDPQVHDLPEGVELYKYPHVVEATNSWGTQKWGGPCPPSGTHRYFFKLYALDVMLDLHEQAKKEDIIAAMEGHILDSTELMGTYSRE